MIAEFTSTKGIHDKKAVFEICQLPLKISCIRRSGSVTILKSDLLETDIAYLDHRVI